jgi:aldose 1-epimerase
MQIREFGTFEDESVREITLENGGTSAKIITYGAALRDLIVPLPDGEHQRVVLGLETLEDYRNHSPHMGAIAGRYANRIANGRFMLDGKCFQLPLNQNNRHSLHGGGQGFGKCNWTLLHADDTAATLALHSPDADAGYPGTLAVLCRYSLPEPATLRIDLSAFTDQPTVLNLAHHSYFNLDGSGDILDHELMVRAQVMTPVDAEMIPDGSIRPVAGTPFDFRRARALRQIDEAGNRFPYDHNFILRRERREPGGSGPDLAHAATLSSVRSGLAMEIWTSEPCLQVYDGAKLNLPVRGLDGTSYGACAGICLEPQHAPDSPNQPHLPSTVLRPGELYRQVSEYRFGDIARP